MEVITRKIVVKESYRLILSLFPNRGEICSKLVREKGRGSLDKCSVMEKAEEGGEEIPRKLKRRPTRRPDKERARLIEKICKAGGASWRRLIRIRVSFGLWFRLRVAGSHQEAAESQEMESWRREREREGEEESERGWNIANHRISILMLRGGAVVSVEGATRWRLWILYRRYSQ